MYFLICLFIGDDAIRKNTITMMSRQFILRVMLFLLFALTSNVKLLSNFSGQAADSSDVFRCMTPNGELGKCISIMNCSSLHDLLVTKSTNNSIVEFMRRSHCGFLGGTPTVCCPTNYSVSASINTMPGSNDIACGIRPRFKINEEPVPAGKWPWIAALGYDTGSGRDSEFHCGGALISDRHVITASQCIDNTKNRKLTVVRLGDVNLDPKVADNSQPITIEVENVIIHPNYTNNPVTNDIAIIKLKQSVAFTKFILPICFPTTAELRMQSFNKRLPTIIGWGTSKWSGPSTNHLQETCVETVDTEMCKKNFEGEFGTVIDESVICARGDETYMCLGDLGGPLILRIRSAIKSNAAFYVIGILSFGKRCSEPGYGNVYTRVTHFQDWIQSNMN